MTARPTLVALIFLACCDSATDSQPDICAEANRQFVWRQPSLQGEAAVIRNYEELKAAVARGAYWLRIQGTIVLPEPLDLSDATPGSFFSIEGMGGHTATGLQRGFCCGPLLTARRDRDWEFRFRGILFDAGNFPAAGPSLVLPYAQLSTFEDLRFENHPGIPFVIDSVDASEFRDIQLLRNGASAHLLNASDFRWRGGAIEGRWGKPSTGLQITGKSKAQPNSRRGPGLIEDVHMEGAILDVRGVANLTLRGGSYLSSQVRLSDVPGLIWAGNGDWQASGVFLDGRKLTVGVCD